jgi:hypothetical protein
VISAFGLRHIWLMRKLEETSSTVDCRRNLLEEPSAPLRTALRGYLCRPTAGVFTYVLRDPAHTPSLCGFVQARALRPTSPWAGQRPGPALNVVCMAPVLDSAEDAATIWYRLLLHLCIAAGEQQVQRLFARLSADSFAEDVFRQASFAVYCHERIFSLPGTVAAGKSSLRMDVLRPEDAWNLQRLWARVTPQVVSLAEEFNGSAGTLALLNARFSDADRAYVWRGNHGELSGYLHLLVRPRGVWLRLLVHPDASDSYGPMLDHALAVLGEYPSRSLYCAVRDYEGCGQAELEARGFRHVADHSLLVKYTTVRVREPRRQLVPSLEKRAEIAPTVSGTRGREA